MSPYRDNCLFLCHKGDGHGVSGCEVDAMTDTCVVVEKSDVGDGDGFCLVVAVYRGVFARPTREENHTVYEIGDVCCEG